MWPVAGFGMDSISKLVINFEILANAEMALSIPRSLVHWYWAWKVKSFRQEDKQSRLSGKS